MQSIVGTVGIVETYMVKTFPVPRFFFGIVGRTIRTVGKQGTVGRNPPVNFEDAPSAKVVNHPAVRCRNPCREFVVSCVAS